MKKVDLLFATDGEGEVITMAEVIRQILAEPNKLDFHTFEDWPLSPSQARQFRRVAQEVGVGLVLNRTGSSFSIGLHGYAAQVVPLVDMLKVWSEE